MRHFLLFLCGLFLFVDQISADKLQDFIENVVKLNREFELRKVPVEKFMKHIDSLRVKNLTEEEVQCILEVKVPTPQEISKMLKKQWTQLERKIFVKTILLTSLGYPKRANELLKEFETNLMMTDVPIIATNHP